LSYIKGRERGGAPINVYLIQGKYLNNTIRSIQSVTPFWETGFLKYKFKLHGVGERLARYKSPHKWCSLLSKVRAVITHLSKLPPLCIACSSGIKWQKGRLWSLAIEGDEWLR